MPAEQQSEDEARARAMALLEATHQFPGEYAVTVIAFNRPSVTGEVKRAAGRWDDALPDTPPGSVRQVQGKDRYEMRPSSAGKYVSHKFSVWVDHAGEVLELYARLRVIEGVVTIF